MTIPQGDNRGPQSISERRKVTYPGSCPSTGPQPSKTSATQSTLGEDHHVSTSTNTLTDITSVSAENNADFLLIEEEKGEGIEDTPRAVRKQPLCNSGHLEVKVTVIPPTDSKKTSQPLLNVLKYDGARFSNDRSRKLSLNLSRTFYQQNAEAQSQERTRRFSQPQRLNYQRVPQEDPSPLSPVSEIFTLQQVGLDNRAFKCQQNVSTYSAEVHAPFHDKFGKYEARFSKQSLSLESSTAKKILYCKQRALNRVDSTSCRSLDDIILVDRGGGSEKAKSLSTNRSASSEDLSVCRKKAVTTSGSSGNNQPRRQPGGPQPSSSSPSHCCLVSVSRIPMAAATSHLTLDSDYQTVRLAVLGAPGVGKSSIVRQFVMQQFMEEYVPTEQRQVFCPAVIINEHLYEVRIIDCPYIPYFPVNSLYEWTDFRGYGLRNATAYVLVYDITSEESFEYIKSLRLQILESRNRHDVPIFVVGNKHDLAEERGVPRREVREIANLVKKQWKCGYIECSAKYNWHIMLLFKELMKTVDYIDYGHKPTSMRVQDALRRNRCLIL